MNYSQEKIAKAKKAVSVAKTALAKAEKEEVFAAKKTQMAAANQIEAIWQTYKAGKKLTIARKALVAAKKK